MPEDRGGRVKARREARGLTQMEVAGATSLSRQSIGSIEAGRSIPSVDVALRLAAALETSVEELFGAPKTEPSLVAEVASVQARGRVVLAHLGGRWVAHAVPGEHCVSADAMATPTRRGQIRAELVRAAAEARENVLILGCALGLGVLVDRLRASGGAGSFVWLPASNAVALRALSRGHTHVAGVHLGESTTRERGLLDAQRHASEPVTLVTLGAWEAGLVVPAGNPRRIRGVADLDRRGVRVVSRETGSGARRLLDRELVRTGTTLTPAIEARGHLEVARLVSLGAFDAGIATRDVAIANGLDFVTLAEERYDLLLPTSLVRDPRVVRLLDALSSIAARRELSALGYDTRETGTRAAREGGA